MKRDILLPAVALLILLATAAFFSGNRQRFSSGESLYNGDGGGWAGTRMSRPELEVYRGEGLLNGKSIGVGSRLVQGGDRLQVPAGCRAFIHLSSSSRLAPFQGSTLSFRKESPDKVELMCGQFELSTNDTCSCFIIMNKLVVRCFNGRLFIEAKPGPDSTVCKTGTASTFFSIKCERGASRILHERCSFHLVKGDCLEYATRPGEELFRLLRGDSGPVPPPVLPPARLQVPAGPVSVAAGGK